VNALVPGFILTEQNRFLLYDQATGDLTERGQRVIAHTPMARMGQPQDLVGPALFLLSDASAFVHGTTLVVDGGMLAYGGV
jgi:NAD(P)-dependent dehydrogenase (short-subunit alcohol dehydrogenase family)